MMLSEKQIHDRLEDHYVSVWGDKSTDEWRVSPADNVWRFDRYDCTITLTCDPETGRITEEAKERNKR